MKARSGPATHRYTSGLPEGKTAAVHGRPETVMHQPCLSVKLHSRHVTAQDLSTDFETLDTAQKVRWLRCGLSMHVPS